MTTMQHATPNRFDEEVYDIVRQIPAGRVAAYGEIARLAGEPHYARRVGRAMACTPAGVPCHRVVASGGRLVPGWGAQRGLLEAEGVAFRANGCVDMTRHRWTDELYAASER